MHKIKQVERKFALQSALGSDYLAEPADILETKRALMALGYYRPLDNAPLGAWVDNDLFAGIRRFQKDKGLKVDGLMRPGGPTEQAIHVTLQESPEAPANDDQPPANDNLQISLLDCDWLLGRDRFVCDRLGTKQLSTICLGSAMSRYSNCLANRPLGPLTTRL